MNWKSDRVAVGCIVLVALVLRVPCLTESLWFDEYYTSSHTIGSVALLLKSLYSDIHPPVYFVFMWAWVNVFGDSEISLRTPPLIAGLGTIVLAFAVGKAFVSRNVGLFAAGLLAVSPVHLWYSTEARPYSAQLALLLLAVLAFGRLQEDRGPATPPRRGWFWTYAAAVFCLAFTHYYMTAYAVAFSVLAVLGGSRHKRGMLIVNIATIALMGCYVLLKLSTSEFQTEKGYLRAFDFGAAWQFFFDFLPTGYTITPDHIDEPAVWRTAMLFAIQALLVAATFLGVRRLARRHPPADPAWPRWHLLAHALWLPASVMALALIGRDKTYIERSLLPALPFWALIVASGLAVLRRRAPAAAWALVGLLAATLPAFYLQRDIPTVYRPNPDWRAAAAWLGAEIDAHGDGRQAYTYYWSPDVLSYYDDRIQQQRTFAPAHGSMERLLGSIDARFGPDSWLGPPLRSFAVSMIDEFEATKAARHAAMQLTIYDANRFDPRVQAPIGERFYVFWPGDYEDEKTMLLVQDGTLRLVEEKRFRWLRGYVLERD